MIFYKEDPVLNGSRGRTFNQAINELTKNVFPQININLLVLNKVFKESFCRRSNDVPIKIVTICQINNHTVNKVQL